MDAIPVGSSNKFDCAEPVVKNFQLRLGLADNGRNFRSFHLDNRAALIG